MRIATAGELYPRVGFKRGQDRGPVGGFPRHLVAIAANDVTPPRQDDGLVSDFSGRTERRGGVSEDKVAQVPVRALANYQQGKKLQ
jgi:hypothetical protein